MAGPNALLPGRITSVLLSIYLLVGCGASGSVQDQIKANIANMETAAEAGERRAFMDYIADGFGGQSGGMTREDFARYLFLQLNERRRVEARLFPIAVDVQGPNLAVARFNVLLTGGAGLIPDDGQLFAVETEWVLEDGEWLLWRADWRAVSPALGNIGGT